MAAGYPVKANYATGDVLTAANMNDLSATVNYAVSTTPTTATQMAGKNKIINGDFAINQRAFSSTTANEYIFDRWRSSGSDGTNTYSAQTFTAGTAPVSGYESTNFLRVVSTGQTATTALTAVSQRIEDVRTCAGQTVTVSFWAKASTGTPNIVAYAGQNFGSGGSTAVNIAPTTSKQAISTSWARYSFVISIPSISGKTIGAGSHLFVNLTQSAGTDRNSYTDSLGIQSVTIDYWGVQVEAGSVATPFQTATGSIQGELAACQRYYIRLTADAAYSSMSNFAPASSTTLVDMPVPIPVVLRTNPTSVETSNIGIEDTVNPVLSTGSWSLSGSLYSRYIPIIRYTHGSAALTQYRSYHIIANNNSAGYLGLSAEL